MFDKSVLEKRKGGRGEVWKKRSAILTTTINLPFLPKANLVKKEVQSVLYEPCVLNHQDTPKHARQICNQLHEADSESIFGQQKRWIFCRGRMELGCQESCLNVLIIITFQSRFLHKFRDKACYELKKQQHLISS